VRELLQEDALANTPDEVQAAR
ncbi:MAG: hypothetical protein JWO46_1680, partial [Nocardioidaceae bacterium]|nr:hypothetical protein [Nocardioidaceae bacterium]